MMQYLELENGKELYCSKIICITRNYADHAKELGNTVPKKPVYFMKPNSALITSGQRIFLPEHSNNVHHEIELAVVISKPGKNIPKKQAEDFILGYAVALDLTARDIQTKQKENGYPWEIAKAFDGSCPISTVRLKSEVKSIDNLSLSLDVNKEIRQNGNTKDMIHSIPEIISDASKYFTLQKGDILLTGTPKGVGQLKTGDIVHGKIDGVGELNFEIE